MSTGREIFGEIGKKIKREADVTDPMGRLQLLGQRAGTFNTTTPCAACKLLRRRCAQDCPFSPYFSPNEPQKFASVHKVFGASNVSKLLMEIPEAQRADAANSLVYEANVRLRDPVYGCLGPISALQQQVQALEAELSAVKAEILKHRYRPTRANVLPTSYAAMMVPGEVSIVAAPPIITPPPPPPTPPPSSMYNDPSTSTDYSSITNEIIPYFG